MIFEDSFEELENFYIGVNDFIFLEEEMCIYDWCLLIVLLFYDNVLGKIVYMVY